MQDEQTNEGGVQLESEDDENEELQFLVGDNEDDEEEPATEETHPHQQETHPHQEAVPIRAPYNPPRYLNNIDSINDESIELYHSKHLPVDQGIVVGMQFHDKDDCILAIRTYHIRKSLDYIVEKSDHERFVIKCKNPNCAFKLRASFRKKSNRWEIGKMKGIHTCTSSALNQDHRKLSSHVISVRSLLYMDMLIHVKVIIAHIREKFNYTISYGKACMAKNKAIESIYRNWEQSYSDLPQWLMVMQRDVPGTVIQFEPQIRGDDLVFHRLFWAFRPCIERFKHCKPIVQVDGTWLYGKYRATLLLVVAQDGNNKIFPIAFALVEGETKESWSFFLRNLRMHVTPQDNICLISDRHKSIKSAYDDPQNGWHNAPTIHVYCILQIEANFMKAFKDGELRKVVKNAGYAMNVPSFDYYRNEIRIANPTALSWIDKLSKEKWTQSHDGG